MRKLYEKMAAWLASRYDKVLHFAVSSLICLYISIIDPIVGIFAALFIGGAKEVIDAQIKKSGSIEWGDIIADVLGIVATAIPLFIIIR